ncbi:MAG: DUF4351 domain-containing protein [Armatimonadetes bacterium]|nr:DUF4351 domain-containing protein [Armatimonadota bacterium]
MMERERLDHDQVWKDLLKAFFPDFVALFLPRIAQHLDFSTAEFRDRETFTDLPKGRRREADLVVTVKSVTGEPEIVLVHIEVQGDHAPEMPRRMWEYYHLLRLRHGMPVLPIVVYLTKGGAGLTRERYTEGLFGDTYASLRYWAIAIPSFSAERFLRSDSILGPALSALMRSGRHGRVRHKLLALSRVAKAQVDEARRSLLAHVVGQYLVLSAQQEADFGRIVEATGATEVKDMVNVFEQKGIEKGIEKGRSLGILIGEAKGMRQSLLWLLERKFGAVSPEVRERIEAISDTQRLGELTGRVLDATSIEQMGL